MNILLMCTVYTVFGVDMFDEPFSLTVDCVTNALSSYSNFFEFTKYC